MKYSFQIPDWLSLRKVFFILAVGIFVLLPILSIDAGISGDEPVHYQHAEYVYNYFSSGGEDQTALNTPKTYLKYYGQVVDNLSYLINTLINSQNPYLSRHILNALLGALLIIFSGLLAVQLAGYRAGILALIFIFLSPRILGHSYNNLKDIPFALGYIMAIYGLVGVIRKYPILKPAPWIWMSLGLAISFGTRAGGLILIPIFFFFISLRWISGQAFKELVKWPPWRRGFILLGLLILTSITGFLIAVLAWPYALQAPIKHSLESLQVMTNYSISIRQLFEGQWVWSEHLPGYYPLKYILISTPIIIIAGFGMQFMMWKKSNALVLGLLNFVIIFPLFWVILKESNLYGAWRHLLFVYPAFVVISACSWDKLWRFKKSVFLRTSLIILLILGLSGPLIHIIKNHPLEYVYFNKLVGGVHGAYSKYETDYYYHSLGPATRWLKKYIRDNEPGENLIIASNFPIDPYFSNDADISTCYTHYFSRAKSDWDYGVFVNTFMGTDYLDSKNWPPDHSIFSIEIEGRVICTIIKRSTKADFYGIGFYHSKDYKEAVNLLKSTLYKDPQNESAQLYLAWAYRRMNKFDLSDSIAQNLLLQQPMNDMARDLIGRNQISHGQYKTALKTFQILIEQNYKYLPAYEQSAWAADSLMNYKLASRILERGYQLGKKDSVSLSKLIQYLQKAEYHAKAERFITILNKK